MAYLGENGTLVVDRRGWEVIPDRTRDEERMEGVPLTTREGSSGLDLHVQNFLECIRTREKPNADIEIGAHIARFAHLGNIAYRMGRKVYWDGEKGAFIDDDSANEMLKASYRAPWKLPSV